MLLFNAASYYDNYFPLLALFLIPFLFLLLSVSTFLLQSIVLCIYFFYCLENLLFQSNAWLTYIHIEILSSFVSFSFIIMMMLMMFHHLHLQFKHFYLWKPIQPDILSIATCEWHAVSSYCFHFNVHFRNGFVWAVFAPRIWDKKDQIHMNGENAFRCGIRYIK